MEKDAQLILWINDDEPLPEANRAFGPESGMSGLLAAGGGLAISRLIEAYSHGIFPWFNQGQPVLWWSPDPRMVLRTENFKLHRSMRKTLQHFSQSDECKIRIDSAFEQVIRACAQAPRKGQPGTWIVDDMINAYIDLHHAGFAHSVETWVSNELVGGLYCVSIGSTLFGESMFAKRTDASKIALAALVAFARSQGLTWIDCQQNTKHLASLGAKEMPRSDFLQLLEQAPKHTHTEWNFEPTYWQTILASKVAL
jgi:leucyl/phenylalanyl-tRNA---protein transferase